MVVYIVWFTNFHSELELVGIFSTAENAVNYIENHSDGFQMHIEKYDLDG